MTVAVVVAVAVDVVVVCEGKPPFASAAVVAVAACSSFWPHSEQSL